MAKSGARFSTRRRRSARRSRQSGTSRSWPRLDTRRCAIATFAIERAGSSGLGRNLFTEFLSQGGQVFFDCAGVPEDETRDEPEKDIRHLAGLRNLDARTRRLFRKRVGP